MMGGGVLKIYVEPESPNDGVCLRYNVTGKPAACRSVKYRTRGGVLHHMLHRTGKFVGNSLKPEQEQHKKQSANKKQFSTQGAAPQFPCSFSRASLLQSMWVFLRPIMRAFCL